MFVGLEQTLKKALKTSRIKVYSFAAFLFLAPQIFEKHNLTRNRNVKSRACVCVLTALKPKVHIPAPAFTPHFQSIRSCLATGSEVNFSAKMVASQKQKSNFSVCNKHYAVKGLEDKGKR